MPRQKRILVTGGSGKIGRHVIADLFARGYSVRALTSKLPAEFGKLNAEAEWRHHDWMQSIQFDIHTEGCDAVLHLGAEIWNIPKMQRLNVDATSELAMAAEKAGTAFMGFTSSIAVYGSSLDRKVTEDAPLLTATADIRSEYLANESLRAYGRSKVCGERALCDEARKMEYVIMRPTVVVDIPEIVGLGNWSRLRRLISGGRHAHYIYVKDVSNALIWSMERALNRPRPAAGVTIYNLSDDDAEKNSYASMFDYIHSKTGDSRFVSGPHAPLFCYGALDMAKNRLLTRRLSLGRMYFPPQKLLTTGYRHSHGMQEALDMAVQAVLVDAAK